MASLLLGAEYHLSIDPYSATLIAGAITYIGKVLRDVGKGFVTRMDAESDRSKQYIQGLIALNKEQTETNMVILRRLDELRRDHDGSKDDLKEHK